MTKRKTFSDCIDEEMAKHPEKYTPELIAKRKENWQTLKWVLVAAFAFLMIISVIYSESDVGKRAYENMDRQNYYDKQDREQAEAMYKVHELVQQKKWDMERRGR